MNSGRPNADASSQPVNDTLLSSPATTEVLPAIKTETPDERMINFYKTSDADTRVTLASILTASQAKILFTHYMQEMDVAIKNMAAESESRALARGMFKKLIAIGKQTSRELSYADIFTTMHKTTALISTPFTSPEFTQRSADFTKTMGSIKSDGNWDVVKGLGYTLVTVLTLGAIACLLAGVCGVFGVSIPGVLKDLTPAIVSIGAFGSMFTLVSGVGKYCNAHEKLSLAKNMRSLDTELHKEQDQTTKLRK